MNGNFLLSARELLGKYRASLAVAWAQRYEHSSPELRPHEAAFLPAHLELMETPPHPMPRWTMRALALLIVFAMTIAVAGKLDIVVTASGEVIPNGNIKLIQPAVTGVVRTIEVRDGQHVALGQSLITLDTRQSNADSESARASRVHAALAIARSQALLQATEREDAPKVKIIPDASTADQQQSEALVQQVWNVYVAKKLDATNALHAKEADFEAAQAEVAKLRTTAPLARAQADAYRSLVAQRDVTQIEALDREKVAQEQAHDLRIQQSRAAQLKAEVRQQQADLAHVAATFLSDQQQDLVKSSQDYATSRALETKAVARQSLMALTAPVDGTVQQLGVHTIGGVVTTGQSLMEIVPKGETLQVKAAINNRDIGFVETGQAVVLKIAAFPYTRYGYLTGTVVELSNDASQDRKRGSFFVAYIRLDRDYIQVGGRQIRLTPGMAVNAEITTGRRRVASYFLDPLIRHAQEALHER